MKKFFKFGLLSNLILIVGLQFSIAQNQDFIPMLNPGAVWFETYTDNTPSPFGYNWCGRKYLGEDTLINNMVYTKVYAERLDVFCTDIILSGPEYSGALRDDTLQKKVWFIKPNLQQEMLYFDFSMTIGDTVAESYFTSECPFDPLVVSDIDTITTYDGVERKKWIFDSDPISDESFVIEGIGFSGGLLQPYEIWQFYINHLRNFHIDTTLIYCHHIFACEIQSDTCISVGITTPLRDLDISIYPNPVLVNNPFIISGIPGINNEPYVVEVYTMSGIKLDFFTLSNFKSSLKAPGKPGLYVLNIFNSNFSHQFKIYVQ